MDGDNESSSDDTTDEFEEEIEPKLGYERLKNNVPEILLKDAASCMTLHTKFLAIGTHLGCIFILDHAGNNIKSKELINHVTTVNHISIDEKGDYIASCSNDGKVFVHGMYSSDLNANVSIDRPVRSVSLDPNFSKSGVNRRFILGEEKVVLYEKSILSRYKSTVLYQGEGPIRNIQWKDQFVVWASDKTVRLYDLVANITVTVIQRDMDPILRPDLYRCNFFWKNNRTLLLGWGDTVKVCNIVPIDPRQQVVSVKSKEYSLTPRFYVEITSLFKTDFCICGISSMGEDIVVLSVVKNIDLPGNLGLRPHLKVIEPSGEDYKLISRDILSLRGYQEYRCNDYHLDSLAEEGLYFILSPRDFVVARPRDDDDHVAWLISHKMFEEAVEAVQKSKNLQHHNLLDVGLLYLDHLLKQKHFDVAAKLCATIFASNKQLWEEEVYKFAQINQLRCVAPYLPIDEPLDPTIYEMVLNEFLQNDQKGFLKLIRDWPCKLYNIQTIVNVVHLYLSKQPSTELHESLGELYICSKESEKALSIYLEIKNQDKVFKLIENHNLFGSIYDKIETLMELNPVDATNLFIKHVDKIPIDLVISKLQNKPELLFQYLQKIFLKDSKMGVEHHSLLMEFYAEYASDQLLSFLKSSNDYALEHAYDICKQRNLIQEQIFLLSRMGNTKQALELIMHKLEDIERAINFCKEQNDKDLWEDLIKYSLQNSKFITVLLQNIGTHVDPIILIKQIPNDKEIPGLRDSLVKILQDYNLQISLREGCEKILVADCFSLLEKLNKQLKKGILVHEDQICHGCDKKLLTNDSRLAADISVFNCKHGFHQDCFTHLRIDTCSICSAEKKHPMQLFK